MEMGLRRGYSARMPTRTYRAILPRRLGRIGEIGIAMRPVIRKAKEADARVVHDIMRAIPWISEATKSTDGLIKTTESCSRGEVYLLTLEPIAAAMIILRKDTLAASFGYNIWRIPLIATIKSERRKGHARRLIRKAKKIVGSGIIQAHVENDKSKSLLISEGFVSVEGETDLSGHPLYEWAAC
jgi:hypothetical protein